MTTYKFKSERQDRLLCLPTSVRGYWLAAAIVLLSAVSASNVYSATGNLIVFDDADRNGFDHNAAYCGTSAGTYFNSTIFVHSGTVAVAVSRLNSVGIGWLAPTTYSTSSDYDGVSFWINAGNYPTELTSLAVYDAANKPHYLHLEDVYGGPLPTHLWVHMQIAFSSPLFTDSSGPPLTLNTLCFINHSQGAQGPDYFVSFDDVSLTGAVLFKSGFE